MNPDSKDHGANMGPIWGRQDPGGPYVGPMNCAIWAAHGGAASKKSFGHYQQNIMLGFFADLFYSEPCQSTKDAFVWSVKLGCMEPI